MLAEIAAANAAFAVIQQSLKNGKDFYDVAGSCAEYFNNKAIISRNSSKRGSKSQLQNFLELEKMRKQEVWIKEWMIYAGDPGMWDRWLLFQSECKRLRAKEEHSKKRHKDNEMAEVMMYLKYAGGGLSTVVSALALLAEFV